VKFPCTACGLCCRIGPRLVEGWPLREDGACAHLNDDNTCAIYDTRPEVCRVHEMQKKSGIDQRTYFNLSAKICNDFQTDAGLDEKYRVPLT
jgi:Fe-S-cluster containining protein